MKIIHSTVATFMAVIFTLLSPMAIAGEGHDHAEAAPKTQGTALPRFVAVSEDLEMVGIVNGKQLTIYLDRFTDNSPVNDAQIDIDIQGGKYKAEKHGVGEYEVILKDTLKPGVIAITATIQAGELNDLLTGELDLHEDEDEPVSGSSWKGIALWIGGGLLALMALGAIVRFRQQARTA
ncbi:hypothetical protein [Limnohabitans parvus]|uniref:hypothetical protein n=1 Tax=Limnohabitans parvus TaxID=540061 RepID=UPI001F0C8C92|nr:hypothetical protein [Limnohabitans parvus]